MPQEKIIIKFEPKGHPELIAAIKKLNVETKKLTGGGGLGGTTVAAKKFSGVAAGLTAKLKAQSITWKQLGVSSEILKKAYKGNRLALEQLRMAMVSTNAQSLLGVRNNRLLANSFATLRSQLLLVSFGAMLIERAFVSLVKAYGRQEAANEKLRVGLANVRGTTEGVTQRLIDYSSALQQTTAFGDEMITTGMVQFTTFGLNEKAIKALTPQVLNVARAIQTVSGAMPDLNSLFIAFGKATTTGIGTLTRYGVVLTETERAQLGSMDANESAVKIAEILARQYGGLAEAYANTTSGMLEATDLARGDAAEAFGEVLAPAVLGVAKGLKIMFEAMSVENIKAYGSGLIIAATATTGLAIATGRLNIQLALTKTAMIRTGIGALVVIAGLLTGKLLDMFGTFEDGGKILTDAEKKLKKFNEALEEDKRLAAELQKVQEDGVIALQKQLDLLNASNDAEKMLINLGHKASEAELRLINQIIGKTEALKAEVQFKEDLIKIDKEIAKLEAAKAKLEDAIAAKALAAEIKALNQEKKDLEQQIKDEIALQAELDAIDKKLLATLKAIAAASKELILANMEKNALFDNQITIQEKLIINDEKWMQVQEKLAAAQKAFDTAGVAAAQKELNAVKKENISLRLQELDQETQGLILSQNRAVLDGSKSALDAEQAIINVKRNQLEKEYQDILHSDTEPAVARLAFKQAQLELDQQQLDLTNKIFQTEQMVMVARIQMWSKGMSAIGNIIGANSRNAKLAANIQVLASVVDAFAAAQSSFAAAATHPLTIINPAYPGFVYATTLASGLAQAAAAKAAADKMETGGLIGGRRHSQGGTMINAEAGEFVMSRSAVQSVGIENLNRMNEGGGGSAVTVNVSGNVLSQDFVEGELAENIKEAIRRGTDFGIS